MEIKQEESKKSSVQAEDHQVNSPSNKFTSLQSEPSFDALEITPKLISFLEILSDLGLRDSLADGLVVYADDESFNRVAM